MSRPTFNLVDRPWIPVAYTDGTRDTLSIRGTLHEAGRIRWIDTGHNEEDIAVLRLLAAIIIRAHAATPRPLPVWLDQWDFQRLDTAPLDRYLDRWADRFDLYHPHHPFLQSPGLACTIRPVEDMFQQTDLFRDERAGRLDPGRAAIRMLTLNLMDAGGIKSADPHDVRATGGRLLPPPGLRSVGTLGRALTAWPQYPTLARTLLANTPMIGPDGESPTTNPDDRPAWERDPLTVETLGGATSGIVDQLTLQSRRMLLIPDDKGRAAGFMLTYGRVTTVDDTGVKEPHWAWDMAGEKPLTVADQYMGMPLWWFLPGMTYGKRRPLALEWARLLAGNHMPMILHLMAAQYRQAAKLIDVRHLHAALRTGTPADPDAGRFVMRAAWAVRAYARFTANVIPGFTPERLPHVLEETALDLSDTMIRLLQDPPDDPYDMIRQVLRDRGDELCREHPMGSAHQYFLFLATLKRIGEDDPDPTLSTKPRPRKNAGTTVPSGVRGRKPSPVTRHGGGLADETFPSVKDAVAWMRGHGRPTATPASIHNAIAKQSTAYGYQWSRATELLQQ